MKDVICIKCSTKEQVNKIDGKFNCCKCGFEMNVEESELIAKLSSDNILLIQNKIKKIETTENYNLSFKIGKLFENDLSIAEEILELACDKGNIEAMYALAKCYLIQMDKVYQSNQKEVFNNKAHDVYRFIKKTGDKKVLKNLLMYQRGMVLNQVPSISIPKNNKVLNVEAKNIVNIKVELEDIINVDSYLEFLKNYSDIEIVVRNLNFVTHRDKYKFDFNCLVVNEGVQLQQ